MAACDCTGNAVLSLFAARIELRDDHAPALGSVSGSLLAAGALKGTRPLSYAATDRGGGVYREQLVVDGVARSDRLLGCSFALVVPCPLSSSGTVALDTTRLSDGEHDVELVVSDATLANHVRHGPVRITVDNVPPPLATSLPQIYGTPREGVTVYADDGTWTGAGLDPHAPLAALRGRRLGGHRRRRRPGLRARRRATPAASCASASAPRTPRARPTPTRCRPRRCPPRRSRPCRRPRPRLAAPRRRSRRRSSGRPSRRRPRRMPSRPLLAFPTAAFQSTGRSTITVRWGERRRVSGTLAASRRAARRRARAWRSRAASARSTPSRSRSATSRPTASAASATCSAPVSRGS